jgi:Flp pilus assembly protein TadG
VKYRFQAGVAFIELVIVLPLLMMLLIGLIEIGRLAYFTIQVGNAAHAGAQYGALSFSNAANTTGMQNAAKKDGQNSIATLNVTAARSVCACWNGTTETAFTTCPLACTSGGRSVTYAQVTVSGTINTLFSYGGVFGLPNQWTVARTATIRVTPRQ